MTAVSAIFLDLLFGFQRPNDRTATSLYCFALLVPVQRGGRSFYSTFERLSSSCLTLSDAPSCPHRCKPRGASRYYFVAGGAACSAPAGLKSTPFCALRISADTSAILEGA